MKSSHCFKGDFFGIYVNRVAQTHLCLRLRVSSEMSAKGVGGLKINMILDIDAHFFSFSASMLDGVELLSSCCVLLRVTHFLLHVLPLLLLLLLCLPPNTTNSTGSHDQRCVITVTYTHTLRGRVKGREDGERDGGRGTDVGGGGGVGASQG